MGPTWGPSGADRTQEGPMLAPRTLLFGLLSVSEFHGFIKNTSPFSGSRIIIRYKRWFKLCPLTKLSGDLAEYKFTSLIRTVYCKLSTSILRIFSINGIANILPKWKRLNRGMISWPYYFIYGLIYGFIETIKPASNDFECICEQSWKDQCSMEVYNTIIRTKSYCSKLLTKLVITTKNFFYIRYAT